MPLEIKTNALTKKSTRSSAVLSGHGFAILEEVGKALFDHAQRTLIPALREYPPELPRQRYRRTFALRNAWHTEPPFFDLSQIASGNDLEVRIVNDAIDTGGGYSRYRGFLAGIAGDSIGEEYAEFVQGQYQRKIHQGRWQTADAIRRRYAPALNGRVHVAIRRGLAI